MVRAILNGRKTVTRRICKDGDDYTVPDMGFYSADRRTYAVHSYADTEHKYKLSIVERPCPICLGDILYVREAWGKGYEDDTYIYKADDKLAELPAFKESSKMIYHPSIHMPKEAARIWLKVIDVRVERLQDITDEQATKEGCDDYTSTALGFFNIWDSTIKKADIGRYGWDANPWVWVIEFSRCERPDEFEEKPPKNKEYESDHVGKYTHIISTHKCSDGIYDCAKLIGIHDWGKLN